MQQEQQIDIMEIGKIEQTEIQKHIQSILSDVKNLYTQNNNSLNRVFFKIFESKFKPQEVIDALGPQYSVFFFTLAQKMIDILQTGSPSYTPNNKFAYLKQTESGFVYDEPVTDEIINND